MTTDAQILPHKDYNVYTKYYLPYATMLPQPIKLILHTGLIFTGIVYLQVCIIAIFTQSLPNQVQFSIAGNLVFFIDLVRINAIAAFRYMLIDQHVILIENYHLASSSQIWGFYLLPVSVFTQLVVSILIAKILQLKYGMSAHPQTNKRSFSGLMAFSSGGFILVISVFYLRLQACCTSSPGWLPEIWLLSQTYNPLLDTLFWQKIYIEISPLLPIIQYLSALLALALLIAGFRSMINPEKPR